jgi:hypothetical protein
VETDEAEPAAPASGQPAAQRSALEERVTTLERDVAQLKQELEGFRRQFE